MEVGSSELSPSALSSITVKYFAVCKLHICMIISLHSVFGITQDSAGTLRHMRHAMWSTSAQAMARQAPHASATNSATSTSSRGSIGRPFFM